MSYGLKYTANFKDIRAVHTYTVNLYQKDYSGEATNVKWYDVKPATLNYRSSNKEDDIEIQGSEFQFSFVAYRQKTSEDIKGGRLSDFEDLFTADYREFILQLKKGADVRWVGYVQPDRLSRNLLGEVININISATDALKELESYKYRKKILGDGISSLMRNISALLDYTDLPYDIAPLDFRINMDTYHDQGGTAAPALLDTYIKYERFISDDDYDKSYDALKKIIKPFGVRLRQASGKYWIQKDGDTNTYNVLRSDLDNFSAGTTPTQVDISSFKYRPYGILSYITPVRELLINIRNRFLGKSVTAIDQNDWENNWTISSFPTGHISYEPSGALTLHVDEVNDTVSPVMDQFEITEVTQDDAFVIRLQYEALQQHIMSGTGVNAADEAVSFRVFVKTPGGHTLQPPSSEFKRATYTSLPYEVYLSMPEELGMYQVGIQVISRRDDDTIADYDGLIQFSDFQITRQTVDQDTTFDRQYVIKNSKGRRVVEKDFYFEDSKDSDIGSFLYKSGGNYFPTSKWDNDLPIVELFAKNYMSAAAKYNEWIRVEVQDPDDLINPENTIAINGKVYFIWGYEKDYYRGSVILSLKQSTYTADSYDEYEIDFPFVRPPDPPSPPDTPRLWLEARPQYFLEDLYGSITNSVVFTVRTENIEDGLSYIWTVDDILQGSVTGKEFTLTRAHFDDFTEPVPVKARLAVYDLEDTFNIGTLFEGPENLTMGLTVSNYALPADADGVVTNEDYGDFSSVATIYYGEVDVTASCTLTLISATAGLLVDITGHTMTLTNNSFNPMTADVGTIIVESEHSGGPKVRGSIHVYKNRQGGPGDNAQTIRLATESHVFYIDEEDGVDPADITLTANLQNITGDVSWSAVPTTTGISGTGASKTLLPANMTDDKVKITASISGLEDTVTVIKVYEGRGWGIFLTNEAHTFPAANDGTVADYSPGYCEVRVFGGGVQFTCPDTTTTDPTVDGTYKVTNVVENNVAGSVSIVSNQYRYTPTNMTADDATVVLTVKAVNRGKLAQFEKVITYSKSKEGDEGDDAQGIRVIPDSLVFHVDKDGANPDPTEITINTDLQNITGDVGWTSIPQVTGVHGQTATSVTLTHANMVAASTDIVKITATVGTVSDSCTVVVVKDGQPGSGGENARTVRLTAPTLAVKYDVDGATPDPTSILFSTSTKNTEGTVSYRFLVNDVQQQAWSTTSTYTYTPQADYDNMPDKVTVQISEDGGTSTLAVDEVSVVGMRRGSNSVYYTFTNHAHTVPADNEGAVTNYSNSGGVLKVYEGIHNLEFTALIGEGKFTVGTPVVTPTGMITVGGLSGEGTNECAIADHSAMNTAVDTVIISYPVTARSSLGDVSFDVTQTITKSKAGEDVEDLIIKSATREFHYDKDHSILPLSIVLTAVKKNITGDVSWTTIPTGITGVHGETADSVTLTSVNMGANDSVEITATLGAVSDTVTVNKVYDGVPPVHITLTPDSYMFPLTSGHRPKGDTGQAAFVIRIFRGDEQFTCPTVDDVALTADNTYMVQSANLGTILPIVQTWDLSQSITTDDELKITPKPDVDADGKVRIWEDVPGYGDVLGVVEMIIDYRYGGVTYQARKLYFVMPVIDGEDYLDTESWQTTALSYNTDEIIRLGEEFNDSFKVQLQMIFAAENASYVLSAQLVADISLYPYESAGTFYDPSEIVVTSYSGVVIEKSTNSMRELNDGELRLGIGKDSTTGEPYIRIRHIITEFSLVNCKYKFKKLGYEQLTN